jgi:hypothetical protein
MAERRSETRYADGGKVKYLIYEAQQRLRNGSIQTRTRAKRLYLPANATDIEIDGPGTSRKRTGRRVHGVEVRYRARMSPTSARRGTTRYEVPERWANRTKVVEVPESAKSVRISERAPEGPHVAVA